MNDPFKPITREEAAGILSVSLTTLDELVKGGALPAPRALGGQRRLYWHPAVFYSHLHRALTEETAIDREIEAEALQHSHLPAASIASRATSHRSEKTTRRKRHPVRTRGDSGALARQAARIKKLNE